MEIFHSWDEWKSAMMTLPEDVFFDLLRSVFGHIKTPFNKQNLLAELAAFLSREDIRRNITAYIDRADARVIAAVALLKNPTAAELEQFFAGEEPETAALLPNLEERFILYRYREESLFLLALNPVLEPVLKTLAEDLTGVFPSLPLEEGDAGGPETAPFDDRFFAALISFVLEEGNLFKLEGRRAEYRLRKKVLDQGRRLFPGMDTELTIRCLLCLGLCRAAALPGGLAAPDDAALPEDPPGPEGEALRPEDRALGAFRNLEPRQRLIYWAAGLCLGAEVSPESLPAPQLLRGRVRSLAQRIDRLLEILSPVRVYPIKTLRRVLLLLEREGEDPSAAFFPAGVFGAAGGNAPSFAGTPAGGAGIDAERLCGALAQVGLLRDGPRGYRLAGGPVPAEPGAAMGPGAAAEGDRALAGGSGAAGSVPVRGDAFAIRGAAAEPGAPVLVMDAPLYCLVYPGIGFADALTLASFTVVRETGPVFRFEVTRESCLRGFERGLRAADMGELLTRLSGNRLEPSLAWTLEDWEKRSAEVSLFEGAVLVLSPERRYLAETEALGALIRRELAPGLYLLDSGDRAAEVLRKAGVDIFTRCAGRPEAGRGGAGTLALPGVPGPFMGGTHSPFPALGKRRAGYQDAGSSAMIDAVGGTASPGEQAPSGGPALSGAESGKEAEVLKARFREVLAGRGLAVPAQAELAVRIERRQVLTESQLSAASVRGEKLEARGLDYVGKASIAKQALASRSLVEVFWSAADRDGEGRMVGVPLALEKSGGESVLVIGDSPVPRDGARIPGDTTRTSGDTIRTPGDTVRIPLGKISLLRRIKKSIFEDAFPKP
jgi:hypothetical protein